MVANKHHFTVWIILLHITKKCVGSTCRFWSTIQREERWGQT